MDTTLAGVVGFLIGTLGYLIAAAILLSEGVSICAVIGFGVCAGSCCICLSLLLLLDMMMMNDLERLENVLGSVEGLIALRPSSKNLLMAVASIC